MKDDRAQFWKKATVEGDSKFTQFVYVAHKRECDRLVESVLRDNGYMTGWEDLDGLQSPVGWLKFTMTLLNCHQAGETYSKEAHESLKTILIALSQLVMRETKKEEIVQFNRSCELEVFKF